MSRVAYTSRDTNDNYLTTTMTQIPVPCIRGSNKAMDGEKVKFKA